MQKRAQEILMKKKLPSPSGINNLAPNMNLWYIILWLDIFHNMYEQRDVMNKTIFQQLWKYVIVMLTF